MASDRRAKQKNRRRSKEAAATSVRLLKSYRSACHYLDTSLQQVLGRVSFSTHVVFAKLLLEDLAFRSWDFCWSEFRQVPIIHTENSFPDVLQIACRDHYRFRYLSQIICFLE